MKLILLLLWCATLTASAADASGIWDLTYTTTNGLRRESKLDLKVEGDNLAGTLSSERGTGRIENGRISGNEITFDLIRKSNNDEITVHFKGRIEGSAMNLTMQYGKREPAAMTGRKGS